MNNKVRYKGYDENIMIARPKKCPVCGRKFIMHVESSEYGWSIHMKGDKNRYHTFCSYKCMRAYELPILDKSELEVYEDMDILELDDSMGLTMAI